MEDCGIIPLRDGVVIRRLPEVGREREGLFIPLLSDEPPPRGQVLGVGPEVAEVKVGAEVLLTRFRGISLGDGLWLVKESEILSVIGGDE